MTSDLPASVNKYGNVFIVDGLLFEEFPYKLSYFKIENDKRNQPIHSMNVLLKCESIQITNLDHFRKNRF